MPDQQPVAEPPQPERTPNSKWRWWHTIGLLAIVIAIGLAGWAYKTPPRQMFPLTLILLTVFTIIAGDGTVGVWRGMMIDERNRMSLSRLQLVLWTIVILSGFLVVALWNISQNDANPLAIKIQKELWMLMGISTTSLVATPLILSTKKDEPPATQTSMASAADAKKAEEEARTKRALNSQGLPPDQVTRQGDVVMWKWPDDARFADLFQGDEIGNAAHLDLGKVQMFFFTAILVFTYAVSLAHEFATLSGPLHDLPALDSSMVALLGISHAGYLTNKAVPHSAPTT